MIRRNNKIMSVVLAMTIISGLVTPVSATEKIEDSSSNQVFSLENADLEKISDDTDILEEISKTEEADNSDEPVEEIIDDIQVDNEQIINDEESEKSESLPEENTEVQEEVDAPLYDSIDEEMENYLKEYLQSLNSGISDEELEKLLQEYLDKINSEAEAEDNLQLEDGIYSIGNNALKMDDEENSLLREYLSEQSLLEVKDGKISVILTFDKNVTELDEYEILLNDKKIKIKTVESDDSILRIKFNINNLDEDIVLKTNVSNDYFSKDEECRIILDTESLEKLEDDIVDEDNESIQDGTYVIANSILKFDQNKESVLGNYLSSESILEVKSGQKYLTLVFDKDVSVIKEFNIYVNNFISSYKVVESNDDVLKVRFLIESIDDEIVVDANITNEFFSENLKAQIILDSESLQKKSDNVYFEESIIPEINLPEINLDEEILPMVEENANKIQVKKLEDGKYTIGTTMIKEDGSGTSSAGAYFSKESDVTVVNGKYKVTLNITSGMVMMSNLGIKVNGQSINIEEQRNGGTGSVSFEIPNLDYEITMSFTITPPGWKDMNHTIIVGLDKSNIKNEKGEFFEIVKDESVNVLDDGEYIIGTKILKTGTQEESMAKGYFKEKSDLISQNGRYNLTLYANNLSMMSNIVVKVNGKEVDIVIKSNSDGTGTLSFDIPSLNSDIVMYCHVDAGIHVADYDFSIGLDKNNITTLAGEKVEAPIEEENAVLSNNTIYKINNELTLNGGTSGLASYLDDTSIIEVDSDGNIYVTINFTMSGLMNGRTIKLNKNTNVTTYAVVNSTDTNGIRFKISSLSDEIHISNQYGSSLNDGFSLVLLEDTLEKTGTISSGSSGSGSNGNEDDADDDDDIEDGTYVIKNYCYKEKSDTTSDARG
ncbi:MAG: NEAT domain-containing protein, partial [Clostridium sp.]|nr:NEAT domain-containing protein [Clostridium sp.]